MSEPFVFDDPFFPVPPAAVDADPGAALNDLLFRIGKLEHSLDEERAQATADLAEVLLNLVSLSDDVKHIVQRWGVSTNAQDALLVRGVLALGKKLIDILHYHRVEPIDTIGKPFDPQTSDLGARETVAGAPAGLVLRELETGYTWKHGLLRRARVVVSTGGAVDREDQDE